MLGATLALIVVAGLPTSTDPATLVGELGSPRYLQRESAEAALAGLGRKALPALRAARDAPDPEVRSRAASVLSRIEAELLVQPTPISFDFRKTPIVDALRAINRQSGLALVLEAEDDSAGTDRRLTLRSAQPVPFWNGIDALCRAGRLHYDFGVQPTSGRRESIFLLSPGYLTPPEPISDSGPFRTHLASVHYQSEILLNPTRTSPRGREAGRLSSEEPTDPRSVASRQFYLQLMVAAEPRLSITQDGSPRVIEAVDDRGRSLLIPTDHATIQRSSGYFGMNPSPLVRFRVDLAYPESPGRRIRRLRGVIPVIAATRKPDPLKVPIDGSAGRTFRSPDVAMTVREVRPARDGQPMTIVLTLKPLGASARHATAEAVDPLAARLESPQQQLEILGTTGEPLAWFPSASLFDGEETRLTLSLLSRNSPAKPTSIAYHGMTRVTTEVPFEFLDVPIP